MHDARPLNQFDDSSWISADILNWLDSHSANADNNMNALKKVIAEVFGSVNINN